MAREPASRELHKLLADVERRLLRATWTEGALVAATGCALAGLGGVVASALGARAGGIAWVELATVVLTVGYAFARYFGVLGRALRKPGAAATWLDHALIGPGPAGTPISFQTGYELLRDRGRFDESIELVDRAIASVDARARAVDPPRIVRREAWPTIRGKLIGLFAATLALSSTAFFAGPHFNAALGAVAGLGRGETSLLPLPPEPRFSDLRITYRYPGYSQRPPLSQQSVSGDIRALPGTEVVIETHARQRLTEATLIVSHGDEDETHTAVQVDGRHLEATLVVSRAGRYRLRVRTEDGEAMEERRGRLIELELDNPPEVALLQPETTPLEVNEQDRVDLEFRASDDFGLGDVRVAWRVLGTTREGRQPLTSASRGKKRHHERGALELAGLELRPGDRVAYTVEAVDNDTVNGPKVGASETKELRVYSKEAHHREVLALAEQALDELVHILGDNLETTFALAEQKDELDKLIKTAGAIVERARTANKMLRETVTALEKDPLGQRSIAQAFEAARKDLQRSARSKGIALEDARITLERSKALDERRARNVSRRQQEMISGLEKNVVYLADLLNDQRMVDAEALTRQLREEQANLRRALEEYKSSPSPEQRHLLEQAIKDIKARISEITSELARLRATIPPDFVNPEAIEAEDAMAAMDRVQKMIEEGDLDGAMAELDRMLNDTERMLSEMQQGREELGSREYSEILEQAEQLWKNLEQIESDQSALGRRTEQHSQAMQKRMKDRLGDPADFIARETKRLEQAKQALERAEAGAHLSEGDSWEMANRRIDDTQRALNGRDFGAARESIAQALGHLRQLESDLERRVEQARRFGDFFGPAEQAEESQQQVGRARPTVEEVLRDLDRLMPSPEQLLSKQDLTELQRLAERQQGVKERANELGEQLDRLAQQLPIVGEGTKDLLGEASQAMGESQKGLGAGDAPGALGQQQRALEALGRLREALQKLGERGKGGGGGGIPLPFGPEGGSGDEDSSSNGNDPRAPDKVEIPKPEQYRAPAEFREDILKAAKQGAVEAYRDAVRRYYEEIIK
ncbi:MAG: DUF4175 family protein [Deltaproteobacteria bacterium]|nr:DUF4175 family protein [Deltaproteobacteria bacterium]